MEFKNSKEALEWMKKYPLERVYDIYGNYSVYVKESNITESFNFTGDWEDEAGNFEPGHWDMNKYTPEEFINQFENTSLCVMD